MAKILFWSGIALEALVVFLLVIVVYDIFTKEEQIFRWGSFWAVQSVAFLLFVAAAVAKYIF